MPPFNAPYSNISDVLTHLDLVIARCLETRSRLGYFAVLYRNVTQRVRQDMPTGRFQNPAQLERLDMIFARRYLQAIEQYWRGEALSHSWLVAFDSASQWRAIILQHLLLGMNAHINFDLAIAAAQMVPGEQLPTLKHDFDEISQLLVEMILDVQARIERVSPWFRLLDRVGGRSDEQLSALALQTARTRAWQVANELAATPAEELDQTMALHDQLVAAMGLGLTAPGFRLNATHLLIRLRESDDVPTVMQALGM